MTTTPWTTKTDRQTDNNNNNDNENEVYKTQRSETFHSSLSLNYDSKYNNSTDDGSSPMVARRKQHFLWKTEGEKKSRYGCGCFERYAFVTFLLQEFYNTNMIQKYPGAFL